MTLVTLTHMRISVDIPDPLVGRAKKLAKQRGTTLRAVLLEALGRLLDADAQDPVTAYRMKDCTFGGDGLVDGLEWTDSETIRDRIYDDRDT